MNPSCVVLSPEHHAPPLKVLGTQVTVLASNGGMHGPGITLQRGAEGCGPPPHRHDWNESFYVLGGQIEFFCDGRKHLCLPGTLVCVPRGTVHGFRYGAGGGRMLEITGADALASQMFTAVHNETPAGPLDIPALLAVLQRNGVTLAA